ncbi:MAG: BrnA antitoxin family protein [Methylococcales bacterium]
MNRKLGRSATKKDADGKTDWQRLRIMSDSDVRFTPDAPATAPEDWADAIAHRGLPVPQRKTQISLRIDEDVLAWFKNQGTGYQTRMNAVLKAYRDAHKSDKQG